MGLVEVVFQAQTEQAETISQTSLSMVGHPLTQEGDSPVHARVTGEVSRMGPLKNFRAN